MTGFDPGPSADTTEAVAADRRWVEEFPLGRRHLGRGWRDAPMINNETLPEPVGPGPNSDAVLLARRARVPTAVLDGRAWRQRRRGLLVVLRVERFGDPDGTAAGEGHRAAWRTGAERSLEETWRARWQERDRQPGWIEALAQAVEGDDLDLVRVEDHTGDGSAVSIYQHLTVWGPRSVAIATVRHGLDAPPPVVEDLLDRLARAGRAGLSR